MMVIGVLKVSLVFGIPISIAPLVVEMVDFTPVVTLFMEKDSMSMLPVSVLVIVVLTGTVARPLLVTKVISRLVVA